jgi:hypothetical protein
MLVPTNLNGVQHTALVFGHKTVGIKCQLVGNNQNPDQYAVAVKYNQVSRNDKGEVVGETAPIHVHLFTTVESIDIAITALMESRKWLAHKTGGSK